MEGQKDIRASRRDQILRRTRGRDFPPQMISLLFPFANRCSVNRVSPSKAIRYIDSRPPKRTWLGGSLACIY